MTVSSAAYYFTSRLELVLKGNNSATVESYESGGVEAVSTQDSRLIAVVGSYLRLAVIDGVTPTKRTRPYRGVDGAVWAAGVTRTLLAGSGAPADEVLQEINRDLWSGSIGISRDQRQATVLVADIRLDLEVPTVRLVRAGDCMAWDMCEGQWRRQFSAMAHTPSVGEKVDAWLRDNPPYRRDREKQFEMEEAYAGSPDAWRAAALGRFPEAKLEVFERELPNELLLATDGLRVTTDDPAEYIKGATFATTDVTAIHLTGWRRGGDQR